jgi:hypothetical protein
MAVRWFSTVSLRVLLWDRLLLDERAIACHVLTSSAQVGLGLLEVGLGPIYHRNVPGAHEIGLGLGQLRARGLERRLVLDLLDHEQPLSLPDFRAFSEEHLFEDPRNTRPGLDGGNALRARHELAGDLNRTLRHFGNDDGGRGSGRCLFGCLGIPPVASGGQGQQRDAGQARPPRSLFELTSQS